MVSIALVISCGALSANSSQDVICSESAISNFSACAKATLGQEDKCTQCTDPVRVRCNLPNGPENCMCYVSKAEFVCNVLSGGNPMCFTNKDCGGFGHIVLKTKKERKKKKKRTTSVHPSNTVLSSYPSIPFSPWSQQLAQRHINEE